MKGIITKLLCITTVCVIALTTFGVFGASEVSAKKTKTDPNKLAPPAISVKSTGRYDVKVSWSVVPGAQEYKLYRSTKKKKGYRLIASGPSSTRSYYCDTMTPGKRYYFKVKETGTVDNVYKDGNYSKTKTVRIAKRGNGNSSKYKLTRVKRGYSLRGKKIVFVGSSLTKGSGSGGVSFPDYIARHTGCSVVKDAIGGTTTSKGRDGKDFVTRSVRLINKMSRPDAFFCQLSANDANKGRPIGTIKQEKVPIEELDTRTVAGAIEYIICYSDQKWGCPIAFYTAMNLSNARYDKMVNLLYQAQEKYGIQVIDLYHGMNKYSIKSKTYRLYMRDRLHPSKAGYLKWVTPFFEKRLAGVINSPGRLIVPEPEGPEVPEEIVEPTEPATDPNNPSESTGPSEPNESEVTEGSEETVSTDNSKSDETNRQ